MDHCSPQRILTWSFAVAIPAPLVAALAAFALTTRSGFLCLSRFAYPVHIPRATLGLPSGGAWYSRRGQPESARTQLKAPRSGDLGAGAKVVAACTPCFSLHSTAGSDSAVPVRTRLHHDAAAASTPANMPSFFLLLSELHGSPSACDPLHGVPCGSNGKLPCAHMPCTVACGLRVDASVERVEQRVSFGPLPPPPSPIAMHLCGRRRDVVHGVLGGGSKHCSSAQIVD